MFAIFWIMVETKLPYNTFTSVLKDCMHINVAIDMFVEKPKVSKNIQNTWERQVYLRIYKLLINPFGCSLYCDKEGIYRHWCFKIIVDKLVGWKFLKWNNISKFPYITFGITRQVFLIYLANFCSSPKGLSAWNKTIQILTFSFKNIHVNGRSSSMYIC